MNDEMLHLSKICGSIHHILLRYLLRYVIAGTMAVAIVHVAVVFCGCLHIL